MAKAKSKSSKSQNSAPENPTKKRIQELRAHRASKSSMNNPTPTPGKPGGRGYHIRPKNNETELEAADSRAKIAEMKGTARLTGNTPYAAPTRKKRIRNEEKDFTPSIEKHFQDKEKSAERSKKHFVSARLTKMANALGDGRLSDEEAVKKASQVAKQGVGSFKASRRNAQGKLPTYRFTEDGKKKGDPSAQAQWRANQRAYDRQTEYRGVGAKGVKLRGGMLGTVVPENQTYASFTSKTGKQKGRLATSVREANLEEMKQKKLEQKKEDKTAPVKSKTQAAWDDIQENYINGKSGNRSTWISRKPILSFARKEGINGGKSTREGIRLRDELMIGSKLGAKQAKLALAKGGTREDISKALEPSETIRKKNYLKAVASAMKKGQEVKPRSDEEKTWLEDYLKKLPKQQKANSEQGSIAKSARIANRETKKKAKEQGRRFNRHDLEADWGIYPVAEDGYSYDPKTGEKILKGERNNRIEYRQNELDKQAAHKRARERKAANIATNGRFSNPQQTKEEREALLVGKKRTPKKTTTKESSSKKKEVTSDSSKGTATTREVKPTSIKGTKIERLSSDQVKEESRLRSFMQGELKSVPKTPYFIETVDLTSIAKAAKEKGFSGDKQYLLRIASSEAIKEDKRRNQAGEIKSPDELDMKLGKEMMKKLKKVKSNYTA